MTFRPIIDSGRQKDLLNRKPMTKIKIDTMILFLSALAVILLVVGLTLGFFIGLAIGRILCL